MNIVSLTIIRFPDEKHPEWKQQSYFFQHFRYIEAVNQDGIIRIKIDEYPPLLIEEGYSLTVNYIYDNNRSRQVNMEFLHTDAYKFETIKEPYTADEAIQYILCNLSL